MPQQPYVSRPEAEDFLAALEAAFKSPQNSPTVFNAWGIGGVGKSTLTRKAKEIHGETAKIATVSFGLTEGIDEPIPLMAKLYEQLAVKDSWSRDPFWEVHERYFDTVHQLSTQAAAGWGAATPEQVTQVKQLLKFGVDTFGELALPETGKKAANALVDKGIDAAVAGLSLKDSLQQLLQQHKATKRDQALQRLMLEPLPQLTQAFAEGLSQQANQQPILLVLDTYEKVPGVIDTWLWRTLLGNTDLSAQRVRLMVAGRHSLLKTEGWRKLHQDRDVVRDLTVERFTPEQTQAYLAEIGMTDDAQVANIGRVTRGLPYYLNWIREQSEKGRTLDFDQGNQEIVRLLLQGLNDTQKRVVQLAACCRWFDSKLIRYLTEQQGLDFATAVDEGQNCYGWLTQLSFAEPIGKRWRLDDVARDVFRQSLERDELETIHSNLADYFAALSESMVLPHSSPEDNYKNPAWLELRSEYLYHLLFSGQVDFQRPFATHMFNAHFYDASELVTIPFQAIRAEFELDEHPLLGYQQRQFLKKVRPKVLSHWAMEISVLDTILAIVSPNLRHEALYQKGSALARRALYLRQKGCEEEALAKLTEGLETYSAALNLKPDYLEALSEKGNTLSWLGRYKEAIAAYDAALKIKPDRHAALNNKGVALCNLGRYEEAITAYSAALVINSTDPDIWDGQAIALLHLKLADEAIESCKKALEIDKNHAGATYDMACSYGLLSDSNQACSWLAQAIHLKPDRYREMAKTDPDFDTIRHDPRFQALLEGGEE